MRRNVRRSTASVSGPRSVMAFRTSVVLATVIFGATNDSPPLVGPASGELTLSRTMAPVMATARGTFDVKMSPHTLALAFEGSRLSRFALDKEYHGDLEAKARGEMLAAGSSEPSSAGYVAIEEVRGTLHGRRGSFSLQHTGTMNRGTPTLSVTIVPDSGTEELRGIAGTLTIIVEGKAHSYVLEYTLPGPR